MNTDPMAAKLITSDIEHFWHAYDLMTPETARDVFQREYLDHASAGLKALVASRIKSVDALIRALETKPQYYASIRLSTLNIPSLTDAIRASFRRLEALLEGAVFPDVYFLIGCLNTGGTVDEAGLLIGTEFFARTEPAPLEEMGPFLASVARPIETLPLIVAHELIHYQQLVFGPGELRQRFEQDDLSLLELTLVEGVAEFFGRVISGGVGNPLIHEYGALHERELWERFKVDLNESRIDAWFYQGDNAKDEPADLGYFIGSRIVEAYWERAPDKKQALRTLLTTTDPLEIVGSSQYDGTAT
jgi:hypothetical protein